MLKTILLSLYLGIFGMTAGADLHAQVILTPKSPRDSIRAVRKAERLSAAKRTGQIPVDGWHFDMSTGVVIWGIDSQCGCNALATDIGMHHVSPNGLLIGTQLLLTSTVTSSMSPSITFGYRSIKKVDGSSGLWSAKALLGPSISNVLPNHTLSTEKYSGYLYGGELDFHPRISRRSHVRGKISIGWLTQREVYTTDGWQGDITTKVKHSGLRIRFGVTI